MSIKINSNELKACPFCGGCVVLSHDITDENGIKYISIECGDCDTFFDLRIKEGNEHKAIDKWNSRCKGY